MMQYRVLGRTGLRVSEVGLGTEYLIDLPREHVIAVIREAAARGVNYFDLFFAQPRFRDIMGEAFTGLRERVILAAHLGAADRDGQYERTRDPAECRRFFLDFLARYRIDCVDVLFLHNCDEADDYARIMGPGGLLEMAREFQREGKTRFIGFSGHTVSTSRAAVESGSVDVLMFTINMAGNAVPGKKELLQECARRGVGVVAMKPFAGGRLLQGDGEIEMNNWQVGGGERRLDKRCAVTPVQCISYALSRIGVSTVVPGCRDLEQLSASLAYLSATEAEKDYSGAVAAFKEYVPGQCMYCNHCLPCPSRIDIGRVIQMLETSADRPTAAERAAYLALPAHAADCIQCGDCVERCPFGVEVIGRMERAAARFA
jgi:predicted aldo/keto reductase-like oxidoreductase